MFKKLLIGFAIAANLFAAGCTSIAGAPPAPASYASTTPTVLTYAHVWGSQAPEKYDAPALLLLEENIIPVEFLPRILLDAYCGEPYNRDDGWIQTACLSDFQGRNTIYILNELTDPAAIENIKRHEAAHFAGWPGTATGQQCAEFGLDSPCDHPGAVKPVGHLDNCLRSMAIANLTPRHMAELCNLDSGTPLQPSDAARWAVLRVQYGL